MMHIVKKIFVKIFYFYMNNSPKIVYTDCSKGI